MKTQTGITVALLSAATLVFGGVAMAQDAPLGPEVLSQKAPAAGMNWFGGPIYSGDPALEITAALVEAGGGASDFGFSKALVSMLGEETVNAEVAKLKTQYGDENVTAFIDGMTFAVNDGLKRATEAGVKLPEMAADLNSEHLARLLVTAGTTADGTWWTGYLFDKLLSHDIHVKVMMDIDAQASHAVDENTHKILNQAMYDIAQALKMQGVKLAPLH